MGAVSRTQKKVKAAERTRNPVLLEVNPPPVKINADTSALLA